MSFPPKGPLLVCNTMRLKMYFPLVDSLVITRIRLHQRRCGHFRAIQAQGEVWVCSVCAQQTFLIVKKKRERKRKENVSKCKLLVSQ